VAGIEAGEMIARFRSGCGNWRVSIRALATDVCILYLHKEMAVNHKKVQRLYRELGLSVKPTRRKHLRRTLQPRPALTAPNHEWALNFASDVTAAGQRFRVLGVIDSFTRQSLVLETATSFPSRRVTRLLERAIAEHGKPQSIRCDNGPELTSRHSWPGPLSGRSTWPTYSPASQRKTGVWRASTESCAMSA